MVESTSFRELLNKAQPGFTMPSRKYLCTKLLPDRCATIHADIKSRLQSAPSVYLTMDFWSSRDMRSFIGVTGHFIVGFTLQSVMLTCRRFYGAHTGVAIHQSYDEIVSEFAIVDKVIAIVTDSASNMVKAFRLTGYVDTDNDEMEEEVEDLEPETINIDEESDVLCGSETTLLPG